MRQLKAISRPEILLVEDNDLDAGKVTRAFGKLGVDRPVTRAYHGAEALEILLDERADGSMSPSHVVLHELNMPRMDGIELLEALRAESRLAGTPGFVSTTSGRDADVVAACRHDVAGYFVKPLSMTEMSTTLRVASGFRGLCELPRMTA